MIINPSVEPSDATLLPTVLPAVALAALALIVVGPRRIVRLLKDTQDAIPQQARILTIAVVLVVAVGALAEPYIDLAGYLTYAGISMLAFVAIVALASRFERAALRLVRMVETCRMVWFAVVLLVLSILAARVVLDDIPHVPDEVAYKFQARAIAQGQLTIATPPLRHFFEVTHTMMDGDRWYGIMSPGWPAMLAPGEAGNAPWLVNPLLAAATLLIFASVFRLIGLSHPEARLAIAIMTISPFVVFLSASYMSHTASLFWFAVFCWSWLRLVQAGGWRFALLAGGALAAHVMVRPTDAVVSAAPLLAYPLIRPGRKGLRWSRAAVVGTLAAVAVVATLLYNHELTGRYLQAPAAKYFDRPSTGRFGIGFGADMGTMYHGEEWPGFYPADAIRVSSYRLTELLKDFIGLPVLLMAACVLVVRRRSLIRQGWEGAFLISAAAVVVFYALHFYHGVAFGPRHYYLAVPALAFIVARIVYVGVEHDNPSIRRIARLSLAAGLMHVVLFAYPSLVQRYGNDYRMATPSIKMFAEQGSVSNAIVFVEDDLRGWKSASFLNRYPIERNDIILAKDLGKENQQLMSRFPGRAFYHLRLVPSDGSQVEVHAISAGP